MLRSLVLVPLTALVLTSSAMADVYKYKDDHGNVLYTDKPSTLPAERLNVQSQKTDVVAMQARQEAEQKRMQDGATSRDQTAAQRSEQQQATQLSAKDKTERCVKARERYDTYMNSQKLYEQQADGERRYLSAEELDVARASAKASMDVMCQ
ncbi:MAG: DUF4124 domain-containing protein [Steroidobacter sp.]